MLSRVSQNDVDISTDSPVVAFGQPTAPSHRLPFAAVTVMAFVSITVGLVDGWPLGGWLFVAALTVVVAAVVWLDARWLPSKRKLGQRCDG